MFTAAVLVIAKEQLEVVCASILGFIYFNKLAGDAMQCPVSLYMENYV